MGNFDKAVKMLGAIEKQENLRRDNEKRIEKYVAKLRPGNNYFTPDQYRDIVNYIYPTATDTERAKLLRDGKFSLPRVRNLARIDIVRVSFLNKERLFSISDLAKELKLERTKLVRLLHRLNMPAQTYKNKKLYDIDMLRERLADKS